MAITSETYDQLKIDKLKLYLQTQADRNAARYYEIYVDNLKAVHKTSDIQEFDSYEDYMTEDTDRIRILVYSTNPQSPRNDQYVYRMKKQEEQKTIVQQQGLSGIEIENRMEEKLQTHRERWEHEALVKELEQTKQQLKESEEYAEKLVAELAVYRSKKMHWGNVNLGEFASVVVEGIVRRNPQMVAKLPGGEALAGIIEDDNRERAATTPTPETEVSFKKKSDTPELSEEEKGYLNFMRGIAESFDDEEIIILTQVITKLEEDSTQLKPVAELLNINVNEVLKNIGKK
ncbi:MAG: hypothetical protein Q7W45_16355 [Bacteroidota bacterium]|nr:hypothetical protein [Bacteroidota bacterium]MDP3145411.1 hypothetical protein [Bacteroidota bacterium]